jgi:hypothetical protein
MLDPLLLLSVIIACVFALALGCGVLFLCLALALRVEGFPRGLLVGRRPIKHSYFDLHSYGNGIQPRR